MRTFAAILMMLTVLTGCDVPPPGDAPPGLPKENRPKAEAFVQVVHRMEPVIEAQCRAMSLAQCDYLIVIDDTPGAPVNAFQTRDEGGRPIIALTLPLILEARNHDELAFVLGHEAAHHMLGHLGRTQKNAELGAAMLGELAGVVGGSADTIRAAQRVGARVGARGYSKAYELEADDLGARLTQRAGYDPVNGAQFFLRVVDPGDKFLGTHPAVADRINRVRRAVGAG